jgi:hypothetical protein
MYRHKREIEGKRKVNEEERIAKSNAVLTCHTTCRVLPHLLLQQSHAPLHQLCAHPPHPVFDVGPEWKAPLRTAEAPLSACIESGRIQVRGFRLIWMIDQIVLQSLRKTNLIHTRFFLVGAPSSSSRCGAWREDPPPNCRGTTQRLHQQRKNSDTGELR